MKKAIIYTRVSTDEQARNGLSLQGQEKASREYCAANDIEAVKVFCDAGESAKSANRPMLLEALEYCAEKSNEIDYFVVWKLDRFARRAEDHHAIKAALLKLGVELRSVTEAIDSNPSGQFMEGVLALVAQYDNDIRAERALNGVRARTEEGGWAHIAPLGYKNIKDIYKRPTLEPDHQAPLIAEWLREFNRGGYSLKEANQLAYDYGIRSKTGKRLSYQQTINMLRNPIYAGLVKTKLIEQPIKGLHGGLITIEEHEQILTKLEKPKSQPVALSNSETWKLRGLLICAECEGRLTGSAPKGRTKNYPMYHCTNCKASKVGHRISVAREILHEEFEELLKQITPTDETLALFKEVVVAKWNNRHKEQRKQQKHLQAKLYELQEKKQRVLDLLLEGKITAEEKQSLLAKVESEILRTELESNEAKAEAVDTEVLIDFSLKMIQELPKLWRTVSNVERQRLHELVFPEGITYDFVHGFGTVKTGELYQLIGVVSENINEKSSVVGVPGFEPGTNRL